jgi:hypothetical protein
MVGFRLLPHFYKCRDKKYRLSKERKHVAFAIKMDKEMGKKSNKNNLHAHLF